MKHYTFVDYATQGYAALVLLLTVLFHGQVVPNWPWIAAAHVAILVFVHGLIQFRERFPRSTALSFIRYFYPVLLYTWFFCETGWLNRMFVSDYLDPVVIRWEQALFGTQPSVMFMEKFPYLWLSEIFYASYFSYYVMISGIGVALFMRNRQQFFHYVSVVSFVFYVCYTIYVFVPIIGPRVFFREVLGYNLPAEIQALAPVDHYPESVKSGPFFQLMAFIYRTFEAPGAAMPSSHVAVAICTVFFSFLYLRKIRYPHAIVAFLLCCATVYCRYHYVVDVIAGVVTAAVLIPLGHWLFCKLGPKAELTPSPAAARQSGLERQQSVRT